MNSGINCKVEEKTILLGVSGIVACLISAYQLRKLIALLTYLVIPITPWFAVLLIPLAIGLMLLILALLYYYKNKFAQDLINSTRKNRKQMIIFFLSGLFVILVIVSRLADLEDQLINLSMEGLGILFFSLVLVSLLYVIYKQIRGTQNKKDHFLTKVLLIILLVWLFMIFTRIGLQPDTAFWNVAGVPMMWVSFTAIILMIFLLDHISTWLQSITKWNVDRNILIFSEILLVLVIWSVASTIWIATPYSNSHFLMGPLLPDGHYWPSSDARLMDLGGQYLIIGGKLETPYFTEKPFYALFLGLLHFFFGQSYETITNVQIMFLALIPVSLYFVGKQISNRFIGLSLALFSIIKETTAILFTYKISVSNSRLMMTELPSALLLIITTGLIFIWMNREKPSNSLPLLAGVTIGIASYVRSNNLFVFFILLLFIGILRIKFRPFRLRQTGFFILGALIVILPWLVYNQITYGRDPITWKIHAALSTRFDASDPEGRDESPAVPINSLPIRPMDFADTNPTINSSNEKNKLALKPVASSQTNLTNNRSFVVHTSMTSISKMFSQELNNSNKEDTYLSITSINSISLEEDNQISGLYNSKVAMVIGHFLNNQVKALFVLPFELYPARPTRLLDQVYWHEPIEWSGKLPPEHFIAFIVNLILLSLGITFAWKTYRWAGLVPLLVEIAYYLSNALVRTSGSRYLVAVDWVIYLYFLLGIGTLLGSVLDFKPAPIQTIKRNESNSKGFWFSLFLSILIGISLPVLNLTFPTLYKNESKAETVYRLPLAKIEEEIGITSADMQAFYDKPNTVFLYGREIYPAYVESSHVPGGKSLSFTLLTPDKYEVAIPYGLALTENLPAGEDMIVLGCKSAGNNQILAYLGYFVQSDKLIWSSSTTFNGICP